MNIAVIGTGYVGLCSGVGLAAKGHKVTCIGRDKEKIGMINRGIPPIYEEGLEGMMRTLLASGHLSATDDMNSVSRSEATFICVGTPSGGDGRIDLVQLESAARQLGSVLRDMSGYHVFVVKSTVVPGTTERVAAILEEASGKKAGRDFGVCMNPEFLREGKALPDFLSPDRIVIGELDRKSGDALVEIYSPFNAPLIRTNLRTAEMIKYASNSLLATKISFSNELGNICKKLGIDVYEVMKGVGMDSRISPRFLEAGIGFGGSCFPKDVSALKSLAEDIGYDPQVLASVLDTNRRQKLEIVRQLEDRLGTLKGKRVALLGLAFKGDTDDIREAPSLDIIKALLEKDAHVRAYDPQAMGNVKNIFPGIEYCKDARHALEGSDACLLLTEWEEFKGLTDSDFRLMRGSIIIEGRRILDKNKVKHFEGVCW
ncbi:MAG: UDP-glucose/GDP-mannose dehydrogenase family protein [Candidatus Aenigmarchaeota archaeon]|nr:UDP-glucose/GDP-mannose dehydrogenase family protein [Candidatus Aenigmarchaeota archaeon]